MYQFHQEQHAYNLRLAQQKLKSTNSWVMTAAGTDGFIKLPNEQILFTSPSRTSLQVSSPNSFPAAQPFTCKSDSGIVYITNQRVRLWQAAFIVALLTSSKIVYLPSTPTSELQSFSSPILNLQDTHVRAPFFGANYWTGVCKPVGGGGIPEAHSLVEIRLTFKDGGAFEFHTIFEQIKERVYQAYTVARENGQTGAANRALPTVHLEQLPAYEPASDGGGKVVAEEEEPVILSPRPVRPGTSPTLAPPSHTEAEAVAGVPPPDGPPPGYEEAQAHVGGGEQART